ncbi:hypothetical protein K504DRAFT_437688 [Pleomassaria siparia CBS 279.74]|uniref:Arrestin-like N-terminal domain-containing protein n=1 Tax=Pleomassaria siparia CBS 279.74 TaxID=1314801 RepID=A0A6G1K2P7_9PLEO|nr:hypothetical protein K504DRAFT_437688 [Pleomassaria siparia CBS 279.74]
MEIMALGPTLRVMIDGDAARVYRQGDQVKGRVILALEEEEDIKMLKVNFMGTCITRTTRPLYVAGNDADASQSRRGYEERLELFDIVQILASRCTLASKKHIWNFDFKFPDLTQSRCSRWTYGSKYMKGPHPLPPSFHLCNNNLGGKAIVSYHIQAKLVRTGTKDINKVTQILAYHPSPMSAFEPKVTSRVLYAQTWKPVKKDRTIINRILTKVAGRVSTANAFPRIVPTLYYVEKIETGQHMPLHLSLANARDEFGVRNDNQPQCTLDSLSITISTFTTSMCGQPLTQPEDVTVKHVTCISRHDINQLVPFSRPTKLTTNFRLVDDVECVPTFRTCFTLLLDTITRRYSMTVVVGIKFQDQKFTIKSTTALEILPRIPREMMMTMGGIEENEEGDVDPLPLYVEREADVSFEPAPNYEMLYSSIPTSSSSMSTCLEGMNPRRERRDGAGI